MNNHEYERGQAVLTVVVLSAAILSTFIAGALAPIMRQLDIANDFQNSQNSYYAAESSSEDVAYRLKDDITVSPTEVLSLNGAIATSTMSATSSGEEISTTGSDNSDVRETQIVMGETSGIGFNYGMQSDAGGMNLSGGATINGTVYSNGSISAISATVTGSATAAGSGSSMGGATYSTGFMVGTSGSGNAWATTIKGTDAAGTLYCSAGTDNNESCNTSKGTPPTLTMPYSASEISNWESSAADGGVISGNETVGSSGLTLGTKEITGNLTVSNGGTLTLTGPLWVEGTVTVTGGGTITLPSSFSGKSDVLVSNGTVTITSGGSVTSGSSGSYLFIVTTSTCPSGSGCGGNDAITIDGGGGAIAANAEYGTVNLTGGASINAIVGYTVDISGGSTVTYNAALSSPTFQGGTSGGYSIGSWQEIQ